MRNNAYTDTHVNDLIGKKLHNFGSKQIRHFHKKQRKIKLKKEDITDMNNFVHKNINPFQILIVNLKKDTSGLNWLWPEFHMYEQNFKSHILSAKKKAANTTSNYYISRNQKQIDVQNDQYMGKVRANFTGSCFNIFNKGINPEDLDNNQKQENVRRILATVIYENQIANATPKSMKIYMIKAPYQYYDLQGTSIKSQQKNLQKLYQIGKNKQKIYLFVSRKPIYNKIYNRYVLNFEGRIKLPSTKNFILQDSQTKKQVLMFGKLKDEEYVLYISSPLTPHIALGIAIAELDSKIICD